MTAQEHMQKRIMMLKAHADDVEYYAGGTVAKFVAQGYEAILVMLSNNCAGGDLNRDGNYLKHSPEKTMAVREAEMRAGAEVLGISVIEQMGFKDSLYFNGEKVVTIGDEEFDMQHPCGLPPLPAAALNKKYIRQVQHVIEKYEPEIAITHNFTSGFDHTSAAHLVNQAFGLAVLGGASLGVLWIPAHVRHCAWQSDVRLFPSPSAIIDITDYWDKKLAAMRAHRSQNVEPTLENIELIDRYWGLVRGCKYAEPFFAIQDARYR
jgi:LmbE family N-acetylglucosaminyl deacetylase